jgi:hypothetical protein
MGMLDPSRRGGIRDALEGAPGRLRALIERFGASDVGYAMVLDRGIAERVLDAFLASIEAEDLGDEELDLAIRAAKRLEEGAIPAAIAAYERAASDGARALVADLLVQSAVQDDRVLRLLLDLFAREPRLAAMYLAEYGDARALPSLHAALDAAVVDESGDLFANQVFLELEAAIRDLGGALTPEQARKCGRAAAVRVPRRAATDRPADPPPPEPKGPSAAPPRR